MTKKRIIQLAAIILAIAGLVWNQSQIDAYHAKGDLNRMVDNPDIPPSLAVTTFALGPMRALTVDALWWRAIEQQDRGEYFDALQLTSWITQLQPNFSSIWTYQAFNMAYNISHDFADPLERWQWIDRAITLLRDEALKYNPHDKVIRHELARLYFDRIGSKIDPHAAEFRNQWALKMRDYLARGDTEELQRLAAAAESLEVLQKRPGVAAYIAAGVAQQIDVLDFETYSPIDRPLNVGPDAANMQAAALEVFYFYQRRRVEQELKLDIERMLSVDGQYGPLDWRLHQAHAIYWLASDTMTDMVSGNVNYGHILRQSMISSFREGRMFYSKEHNTMTMTNNVQIIGRIHEHMENRLVNDYSQSADNQHKRFLEEAITVLYIYNLNSLAYETYEHYSSHYLRANPISYETFLAKNIEQVLNADGGKGQQAIIEASLYEIFKWLDIGHADRANGSYNLSRLLWKRHQTKYHEAPAKQLPPFVDLFMAERDKYIAASGADVDKLGEKFGAARRKGATRVYIGPTGHKH